MDGFIRSIAEKKDGAEQEIQIEKRLSFARISVRMFMIGEDWQIVMTGGGFHMDYKAAV